MTKSEGNPNSEIRTRLSLRAAPLSVMLALMTFGLYGPAFGSDAGDKAKNFSLLDQSGTAHELYGQRAARAVVLIFTATGCPIAQKSVPKIKALRDAFEAKGIIFWLIDSNAQDDLASIREEAKEFRIDLPILGDQAQRVARALGVTRTAEVVCVEPKSWTVFYRGAIDDRLGYGSEKKQASHAYLENALNNFLAGKEIFPARTEVKGCLIHISRE